MNKIEYNIEESDLFLKSFNGSLKSIVGIYGEFQNSFDFRSQNTQFTSE